MTTIRTPPQPTLQFYSLRQFQDHFVQNKTLSLFAKQRLLISNFPSQLAERISSENPTPKASPSTKQEVTASKIKIEEVLRILSEMLHPIGKIVELQSQYRDAKIIFECGADCSLQIDTPITFKALPGTMRTQLSALFSLMIESSRLSVRLAKNQKIELDGTAGPKQESGDGGVNPAVYHFHQLAEKALPDGYLYRVTFNQMQGGVISHTSNSSKKIFGISSSEGMQISLICSVDYQDLSSFADALYTNTSIKLAPGSTIRIHDPAISLLNAEYEQKYEPFFTPISFLLGHLFHILRKVIVEDGDIECTVNGTCLELSSKQASSLTLQDGEASMAVCHLENCHLQLHPPLYRDGAPAIPFFDFNKPFTIYGLSEDEFYSFDLIDTHDLVKSTDECFHRFFARHMPVGFISYRLITDFVWETIEYQSDEQRCLALKISHNPNSGTPSHMKFCIAPATSVEDWILPIFNRSSPALLKKWMSGDYVAIQMVMIKVILHYCITGRHYLENPPFFSAEIKDEITNLVDGAKEPEKTYALLKQILLEIDDPHLSESDFRKHQRLMEIPILLRMDPDDFNDQRSALLSPEAILLISKLLAIVSKADRPLFTDGLANFYNETK